LLPFRVFGTNRTASDAFPPEHILSWNAPVVQSIHSPRIADISFTNPLRRWPFPRPCGLPWANVGWVRLTSQLTPLVDFSVPPESFSADPSHTQPHEAAPSGLLSWALVPYSTFQREGSTDRRPCQDLLRSALRVWLPSRRFPPLPRLTGLVSSR
jgi:hypothetical protein